MALPPEPAPATPPVVPGYPARWEFDAVLTDGGTVHIRPITPGDADAVEVFHNRQSRETIYLRYFSPRPRLSARDLERVVNIDYVTRMALVAFLGGEIVGIASYDIWPDHNEAEVAFMVDDEHQGRGLATVLLEYLAVAARENGLDGLTATVLPTNRKMLGVFHDAGFQVSSVFDEGVIEVRLGIEPTAHARRLHRAARAPVGGGVGQSPAGARFHRGDRRRTGAGRHRPRGVPQPGGRRLRRPGVPGEPGGRARRQRAGLRERARHPRRGRPGRRRRARRRACSRWSRSAGASGSGGLVIFSAGFDRLPEGTEQRIVERAHATGMRVIGPESMGVINTAPGVSLVANFGEVAVRPGNVGFLTQSGTLGLAALDHAHRLGVGFSAFVDVGSKIDVSGNDLLQYWADDERTTVVALHLQSFGNPRKFTRIVRDLARVKPVVAVKSGLTRPGGGRRHGGADGLVVVGP